MKRLPSILLAMVMLPAAALISLAAPATASGAVVCANTADTALTGLLEGAVIVPEGADCYITDATITGAFRAIHSPGAVSVINTHVLAQGGIFVNGATESVTFGTEGCLVDPYAGRNLKVFDSHNVAICQMAVRNKMIRSNIVANKTVVYNNVDTGQSVNECRADIRDANGL